MIAISIVLVASMAEIRSMIGIGTDFAPAKTDWHWVSKHSG